MRFRPVKPRLAALGLALVAVAAVIGVLHAPFGRALLTRIGGCPVGHASAADVERARAAAAASMRGVAPAASRPALGFELGRTTPEDAHRWADAHGFSCVDKREGMLLACTRVPADAFGGAHPAELGGVDEVMLAFRPRDRVLVNATATSFGLAPDAAAARTSKTVELLTSIVGQPAKAEGGFDGSRLSREAYASTATFAFSDYVAEVSATSMGVRGVLVREHYMAAAD